MVYEFLAKFDGSLSAGIDVTALVRDPAKLSEEIRDRITVVVGDVTNASDVRGAVEGQDAAVVVLGTRNDLSELVDGLL